MSPAPKVPVSSDLKEALTKAKRTAQFDGPPNNPEIVANSLLRLRPGASRKWPSGCLLRIALGRSKRKRHSGCCHQTTHLVRIGPKPRITVRIHEHFVQRRAVNLVAGHGDRRICITAGASGGR